MVAEQRLHNSLSNAATSAIHSATKSRGSSSFRSCYSRRGDCLENKVQYDLGIDSRLNE